jgi:uncharacterized protein
MESDRVKKLFLPHLLCSILVISAITGSYVFAVTYPNPSTEFYVNDFSNLINGEVENNILNVNKNYENTLEKPQIVVVTVPDMQGLDEYAYSVGLFENWKIGNDEYDNGVLILLAMAERRIKVEVGYGLEGVITDAEAGRILDDATDYLSSGDYSSGINQIFINVASRVNEEYGYDNDEIFKSINTDVQENTTANAASYGKLIMLILLLIIIGGGRGGRRRRGGFFIWPFLGGGGFGGGSGGYGGGGFGGGGFGGGGSSGGGGAGRGF